MMYFILLFGLVLFGVVCCLGFFSVWIECHWCLKGNPLLVEINTGKTRQNKIICKTKIEIQLIRRPLYIYIQTCISLDCVAIVFNAYLWAVLKAVFFSNFWKYPTTATSLLIPLQHCLVYCLSLNTDSAHLSSSAIAKVIWGFICQLGTHQARRLVWAFFFKWFLI